jgi:hypothetical protein
MFKRQGQDQRDRPLTIEEKRMAHEVLLSQRQSSFVNSIAPSNALIFTLYGTFCWRLVSLIGDIVCEVVCLPKCPTLHFHGIHCAVFQSGATDLLI